MADKWSTSTEDWAIADEDVYVDNPEFVYVKTDSDGKILWAIKTDGSIYYGAGCPQQVKDYIEEKISNLSLDEYEDIVAFLSDYLGSDTTLKTLIDSKLDADGLNPDALETVQAVENAEYIQVTTDSKDKIFEGITSKGVKQINIPIETPSATIKHIESSEWVYIKTDADGRIIEGIRKDGHPVIGGVDIIELKNEIKSGDKLVKYAHNYGLLPSNDAQTNADILNTLLQEGNIDLTIAVPGIYKLNHTVKIGSNTHLTCQEGVIFTREGTYFNIFINTSATIGNGSYNENITIDGLNLNITQQGLTDMDFDSPSFGLRGLVGFSFVKKLVLRRLTIYSVDSYQFGLHICKSEQVVVDGFDIRLEKDGIHVGSLKEFVFSNGIISTDDDGIGLNAYDFYDCNLVEGNVTNGLIENITTLIRPNSRNKGSGIRMMVGAFVDWYDGIKLMNSELVKHNGRIYRVLDEYGSTRPAPSTKVEYTSHTEPTLTSFNGSQQDVGGFTWKLNDNDPVVQGHKVEVMDIVIRNIKVNQGGYLVLTDIWPDGSSMTRRTLHPDVPSSDYPHIDNIVLENITNWGSVSPRIFETFTPIYITAKLVNCRGFLRKFQVPVISFNGENKYGEPYSVNMPKRIILDNYDFRTCVEEVDVDAEENTEIIIRDCIKEGNIIVNSQGSIKSNCSISALPTNPKKGDTLILDGVFKNYNGSEWI